MATTEEILGQFLGDETFPVAWDSEVEQDFFWVYDDLHCPHPVSPMFFDIGGWWLSCDHMFRRFGTPFAVDWLAKNVNGYVYTTAIPADPELRIDATEYSARYGARVPRDEAFASTMGAYLDTVLPVYGRDFADWWRDRLRPEMERNFAFLEARLDAVDEMDLADVACLLEDAIDVHDRHWKIHWMLNFAQLSATLNLRAVMDKHRGRVDEPLLGRLQNSATDRNWDSIEALWRMKNEVRDDPELRGAFARGRGRGDRPRPAGRRARPAVHRRAGRAVPARVRLARRVEPRVHLPDRARADGAGHRARPRLPRGGLRLPERDRGDAARHRGRLARGPRRADRRRARGDARRECRQPADGAAHPRSPFLHRPGRQRARPAGPHRDRPEAGRRRPARPARRRDVPPLQRAARPHRQRVGDRGPRDRRRAPARAGGRPTPPSARLGRDGDRHRSWPSHISSTGATRIASTRRSPTTSASSPASGHRPARSRGSPASCARSTSSTRCARATSSSAR